ncbi:MAG: flagellar hook-length control protein FliK [Pseudomonadota bacterium]
MPADIVRADLALAGEASSRTAPALPVTPPPATPEAARAISLQVIEALRQGSGTIDVTLVPEELGRLRLSIGVSEGAMLVTLSAERPETLDLMRRHIDILQAEARAEGFAELAFAFSGDGPPQDQTPPNALTLAAMPDPEPRPFLPAQGPQAGLDLRL